MHVRMKLPAVTVWSWSMNWVAGPPRGRNWGMWGIGMTDWDYRGEFWSILFVGFRGVIVCLRHIITSWRRLRGDLRTWRTSTWQRCRRSDRSRCCMEFAMDPLISPLASTWHSCAISRGKSLMWAWEVMYMVGCREEGVRAGGHRQGQLRGEGVRETGDARGHRGGG